MKKTLLGMGVVAVAAAAAGAALSRVLFRSEYEDYVYAVCKVKDLETGKEVDVSEATLSSLQKGLEVPIRDAVRSRHVYAEEAEAVAWYCQDLIGKAAADLLKVATLEVGALVFRRHDMDKVVTELIEACCEAWYDQDCSSADYADDDEADAVEPASELTRREMDAMMPGDMVTDYLDLDD